MNFNILHGVKVVEEVDDIKKCAVQFSPTNNSQHNEFNRSCLSLGLSLIAFLNVVYFALLLCTIHSAH